MLSEMAKYIKTLENHDWNVFFLETLAWINCRRQKLIPNNKESSLFPEICCFRESCCIVKLLQWSSLWICKKILRVWKKKWNLEWMITDSPCKFMLLNYLQDNSWYIELLRYQDSKDFLTGSACKMHLKSWIFNR